MRTANYETIELLAGQSRVPFCETLPKGDNRLGGRSTGGIPGANVDILVDLNCHRFLSSGSVSRWMSEWRLCHNAISRQTAEVGVQCNMGEQDFYHKHVIAVHPAQSTIQQPEDKMNESTSSSVSVPPAEQESTKQWLFDTSYILLEDNKGGDNAANFLSASFMTTTTTSETQTSEMDLYRRASYLEEYAAQRVHQMRHEKSNALASCKKMCSDLKDRIFRVFACFRRCCGMRCICRKRGSRNSTKRKSKTSKVLKEAPFKEENMDDAEELSNKSMKRDIQKMEFGV